MFEAIVLAAVIAGLYFLIKAIWDYELEEVESK
jgi:predicted secreted protein